MSHQKSHSPSTETLDHSLPSLASLMAHKVRERNAGSLRKLKFTLHEEMSEGMVNILNTRVDKIITKSHVITTSPDDLVVNVLGKMNTEQISAVPVLDTDGGVVGVLRLVDVLRAIIKILNKKHKLVKVSDIGEVAFREVGFDHLTVKQLIESIPKPHRHTVVAPNVTLGELLVPRSRLRWHFLRGVYAAKGLLVRPQLPPIQRQHRVIVAQADGKGVHSVLSQSAIVRHLYTHRTHIDPSILVKPAITALSYNSTPYIADRSERTIDVYHKISYEVNGCAVITHSNMDYYSLLQLRDLKGLTRRTLHTLLLPVYQYLDSVKERMGARYKEPATCVVNATVAQVLEKAAVTGAHNIVILDNANGVRGVVTLTDIINGLVPYADPTNHVHG